MRTLSTGDGPAEREVRPEGDELAPGERVGAYRIGRLLGRGGMGEVYEADDTRLGRKVALKRIASHRKDDGAARARFWREARGLAAVRHEGLVAIYEIGEDPRVGLFIAMELVDGAPLSALVSDGSRLPVAMALDIVIQAASALGAAHLAGLVHRDVKPGNLLVERGGRVRVVDFGLARRVDDLEQLTRDGAVLGTPAYMAPEQVEGREAGAPADVFALGLVLYRLLSGVHPFARESAQATALAIAGSLRRPLLELCPELMPRLAAVVDKALAVRPEDRYPDGNALAAAVGELVRLGARDGSEMAAGVGVAELVVEVSPPSWPVPDSLVPSAQSSAPVEKRSRGPLLVVGVVVLGLAGFGIFEATRNTERPRPIVATTAQGAVVAVGEAGVGARPGSLAGSHFAGVAGHENTVLAALPSRPALMVLGFEADERERGDALVMAELLRARLSERAGEVHVVPLEVSREMVGELSPALDPLGLARDGRGPGHVDLVIRGRYWQREGLVGVEVEVASTASGKVLATWTETTRQGTEAPIQLGLALSLALEARLGLAALPARAELSRVPAAWTALMAARRAARGADLGGARSHLEWALRADPDFALARVEELAIYRMEGRPADLLRSGRELLARPERMTPQALGLAKAHVLWAESRSDEALKALDALLERFPYEVDPAFPLMALRAKDPHIRDPAEVERIARRILTLAPRQETSASRYVRALGIQGRIAEAERFLLEIGLTRDDPELAQIWAEVDLFAGRFDAAGAGFARVLADEPGNVYYEHLAITSELLAGRCVEAAGHALDRITRLEALGRESMLDWTYSLAVQATLCAESSSYRSPAEARSATGLRQGELPLVKWKGLASLLEAWARRGTSGSLQSRELAERFALMSAKLARDTAELARLEAALRAELLGEVDRARELGLAGAYLQVGSSPDALDKISEMARRRSLDREVAVPDRSAWRTIELGVAAKRVLAAGGDKAVISLFDAAIPEMRRIAGEDEARWYVEALVWKAEALETLGEDSRAAWRAVLDLGFHRLWFTELWVLARERVAAAE